MVDFKIERGIAVPTKSKYPFADMEVGDSFMFNGPRVRIAAAAHTARRKFNRKFIVRAYGSGFRVWRTK